MVRIPSSTPSAICRSRGTRTVNIVAELHNAELSANYLPWLILDQGSLPMPPYVKMLRELYEKYPIISAQGVMDMEGNVYTGVADVQDDPLIQKYQYIQYANLFDELDEAWFAVK